jgi:hypothetical protein
MSHGPFQLFIDGVAQYPWHLGLGYTQHVVDDLKKEHKDKGIELPYYVLDHATGNKLFQHPSPFAKMEVKHE